MERLTIVKSIAVPWLMPDVDTDVITPMRHILLHMDTLERYAFEPYRYLGGDADKGDPDPAFPLNQPAYQGAQILIVGENFGCGSSRETAAEAIRRCGFRCLIGSSFANIFFKNCGQQGILPIVLKKNIVEELARQATGGREFVVNLFDCCVTSPAGERYPFQIQASRRKGLLLGLDDIGLTLLKRQQIDAFYEKDRSSRPWLYQEKRCVPCK